MRPTSNLARWRAAATAHARKLLSLTRPRRLDTDLRDELAFHLSEDAEHRRAAGVPDRQARSAARRELGNVAGVLEDTRAVWKWIALEQIVQDVRYGWRGLVRTPSVALACTITLALGVGLTSAMFSVVRGVLLRPVPLPDSSRLVVVQTVDQGGSRTEPALSPPNFMSLQDEESRAFAGVAAVLGGATTLTGAGQARRFEAARVSTTYFDVLGVTPVLGRGFRADESVPGEERVAVLSHALWQQQFGGRHDTVGQEIVLDGVAHVVIGVAPQGFPGSEQLWVPLATGRGYFSSTSAAGRRNNAYVRVLARLRPGITAETAQAELDAFARRLEERFPEANAGVRFTARPLHDDIVGDVRTPLLLMLGAVGFVLLIASANVAGLLLARGAARRHEIAIRGALGAGRLRIVRQLLIETLLLASAGGVLGSLLAYYVTSRLVAGRLDGLRGIGLAPAAQTDGLVVAFTVAVTLLTGLLAGLLPAFRAADDGLAKTLRSAGSGGGSPGSGRLRGALVVGQFALAVVLLHGAGLLINSFVRLTSVDPGFSTERALTFSLDLPSAIYRPGRLVSAFYEELLANVGRQPGVMAAGAISRLPIRAPGSFRSRFRVGLQPPGAEPSIAVRIVTPGYFSAMGMAVVQGRAIDGRDRAGTPPVVVINETAAAQFFSGQDPIGRHMAGFSYDPLEQAAHAYTVIGIVSDVRSRGLREQPQPEAYFAHAHVPHDQMTFVVRTAADPLAAVSGLRSAISGLDRNLPMPRFRTLDQVVAESLDRPRFVTTLLGLFSGVALVLAAVGTFGLLSFAVARRTKEMGVRIALGASPSRLVGAIVREALTMVAAGLAIGLGGALALTQVLQSELFGVTPSDPATFAGVAVTLAAAALIASLAPAWRAAAVDPLTALRTD